MGNFLNTVDGIVWGIPMLVLVMFTGIYYTIRLKNLSFTKLGMALKLMFSRDKTADGEVTSFGAICTTLAGNLVTGNIVGVATALVAGGPGAMFWIWMAAGFGMSLSRGRKLPGS